MMTPGGKEMLREVRGADGMTVDDCMTMCYEFCMSIDWCKRLVDRFAEPCRERTRNDEAAIFTSS
jgi:hypothetical protein